MPSIITQNIGSAVAQIHQNQPASGTGKDSSLNTNQIAQHASQESADKKTTSLKSKEKQAPRVPKRIESPYNPQSIKNAVDQEKQQEQPKDSEVEEKLNVIA